MSDVVSYASIKFDRLSFQKNRRLLIPPLYKSKRCEQKLMLSVGFIWIQTHITGMK